MHSNYFKHPSALVESKEIGAGTRIWAFAHIMSGAQIGINCNIGDHCFIESKAQVGNNVTIKNHVAIWEGVTLEDGVFIGPNVSLTNDERPRSRNPRWLLSETKIKEGATIGANATVLCGLTIGDFAFVGAGSVVTRDVPPYGLVYGNPARLRNYVCRCAEKLVFSKGRASCQKCYRAYRTTREGVYLVKEKA